MEHFSHEHPLILNPEGQIIDDGADMAIRDCDGCETPISKGAFYSCVRCGYFLHEACAKLPEMMDHPLHPKHTLTLLSHSPYKGHFGCDLCREVGSKFVYHCSECGFDLDTLCAIAPPPTGMICCFSHEHPLFLIPETISEWTTNCEGCWTPISGGPFYSCVSCCDYFLHKECTQLPDTIDHPLHPQHTLTLYKRCPVGPGTGWYKCSTCRETRGGFVYFCDECCFPIDTICAQESNIDKMCAPLATVKHFIHRHPLALYPEERKIVDGADHSDRVIPKCNGCSEPITGPFYSCGSCNCDFHKACAEVLDDIINHPMHPQHTLTLITSNYDLFMDCDLCGESLNITFYGCSICSFKADIKCLSPLPTIKISYHDHLLALLPPGNFSARSKCDICYSKLLWFQYYYGCLSCRFFAHVGCAISESKNPSSRDENKEHLLPFVQQRSTELISQFVEKFTDQGAEISNKIDHFDHEHPLFLIDEQKDEKICEACAVPISPPLFGCIKCDCFLHKCCAQLPEQTTHPLYPKFQFNLTCGFADCDLCHQKTNGFYYKDYPIYIDIKCASVISPIHHEAHRHPLTPRGKDYITCTACRVNYFTGNLQCETCSFKLCYRCAMAPPIIYHRFGKKDPFILTYSPPVNHYDEYICEICEGKLDPKEWYYHCGYCDQFTHIRCMIKSGADHNIVYGKSHKFDDHVHEHELTVVPFAYNYNGCSICRIALNKGFSVGLECIPCDFKIHLQCSVVKYLFI